MILFYITGLLLFSTPVSAAENGPTGTSTLRGIVQEEETGKPIGYVYLHLEELNRTATTHTDGSFRFTGVPAGTYTLTAYRIGYKNHSQQVEIGEDEPREILIRLRPAVLSSEAVRVVGRQDRSVGSGLEHASKNISGNQLRQDLGNTLAKTLEDIPGLSSRTMGSAPARPVIRGLGGERVLILQDGERTGDISAQSADHAVTVDPMAAEKIEIARGPAALIYGSNAIGGVINVVRNQISTSLPDHMHGTASIQGETVSDGAAGALQTRIPMGSFVLQIDGNLRSYGNIETPEQTLRNSGLFSTNDAAGLSYVRPWGYAGIAGSVYSTGYGVPPDPAGGHEHGVDIDMRKYQFDARSEIFFESSPLRVLDLDFSYKNYFHRETEPGGAVGTEYGVLTSNASASVRHDSLYFFSSGTIGIRGEAKDYAVNGANTPDSDSYRFAAYITEEMNLGPLHLEGGVRLDHIRTVPAENNPDADIGAIRARSFSGVSSSLSAIYHFGNGYYLGTTLMHSFRAPSQEELYSEGPHLASYSYEIGNPDLDPERGVGKELFFRYRGETASGEVAAYHNAFSTYIYPRNTGNPSTRFPSLNEYQFTGADALFYGLEVSGEKQLIPTLAISGSVSYTRARREVTLQEQGGGQEGRYQPLPMIPPLQGNLSLSYGRQNYLIGFRTRWAADQDRTGDFEQPTPGYAIFDLYGQYRFQAANMFHTVSLNVENLLDREYRSHLSRIKELVPEPGQNISLLYRVYF